MVAGKIAGLSKQDYVWQVVPSFVILSEFDEAQNKSSLGIKERFHVNAMSVVIMSTEYDWRTDFAS